MRRVPRTSASGWVRVGGDYDEDGQQDLYVSNMFSKAGTRITEQLAGLDERFGGMARGNSLFKNGSNGFAKVSGIARRRSWSRKPGGGGAASFVDVNNDGYLDLYALSGYYAAPEEVELPFRHMNGFLARSCAHG